MSAVLAATSEDSVLRLADIDLAPLRDLLADYGLDLDCLPYGEPIPGSYWGEAEAGLKAGRVLARPDTPVHSVLHEACHVVCMEPARRADLDTDVGDGLFEENATCYLQILLADRLPGVGRDRLMADMDAWGYSFRLGSARAWFEDDAEEARAWLQGHGIIDHRDRPTGTLRGQAAAAVATHS